MARVKGAVGAKKRHNRTLKLAKGYRGARSKPVSYTHLISCGKALI